MKIISHNRLLLRSYLLFLCTIPFGEVSLGTGVLSFVTPTKLGFLVLMAVVLFALIRGWRPRVRPMLLLLPALFAFGSVLAAVFSTDPADALVYSSRLVALALLCAVTGAIAGVRRQEAGDRRPGTGEIFLVLFMTGCVLAMLGIYQTLTGTTMGSLGVYGDFGRMIDIFLPGPGGGISVVRASSTFDHPNIFGTFMIGVVPMGVLLFAREERRWLRATIGAGVLLCVVAIVYTFSRSAWIGLALGMLLVSGVRGQGSGGRGLPVLALLVLGVLIAVALLPQEARGVLWNRGGTVQAYDAGRLYSFRAAGRMIADHPVLGVGPGMFDSVFDEYGGEREAIHQNRLHTMDAHNTLLDLGAEAGLLTAIPFAALLLCGLTILWRRRAEPGALVILAALAAVSFQSLLNSLEYEEIFWVLLGMGVGDERGMWGNPGTSPES